jgi:hypothetical protein
MSGTIRSCPTDVTVIRSIESPPAIIRSIESPPAIIRSIVGPIIIAGGASTRPPPVLFAVATAEWIVNHNLGYVPTVMVTDLAGNMIGVEVNITTTQIFVRPNAAMTGYVHYY